ncbi:glycosyltransferase [Mucilaginibacter sp. RS28]|uniref:Glycosyltransferase n=1 Tax=Mucilaginibacter straminoryzae TaxID=2932774 RepID=A0A9X1X4J8_9SPHI|nr:glycosyltransferase [Mucilaginibacter straminoryzae]MCJ8210411.1 glycosyltransferase [Mucilaginibacter straminoryzae]
MESHHFDRVTLLITHYNRSKSLEHLLAKCAEFGLSFQETIVSDDGSKPEHLEHVKQLQPNYGFRLVSTPVNKGLGNNINKGQDAVTTPYTLYVQEDFEPTANFAPNFTNAVRLMDEEKQWDLIRFYTFPWAPFPYLRDYKYGFSEMLYRPQVWFLNHLKFRIYSDHPHLRRSDFLHKFCRYREGERGDPTEYAMCLCFIKKGGKALMFKGPDLFLHEAGGIEPNTMVRSTWKLKQSVFVNSLRFVYLKGKVLNSSVKLMFTDVKDLK